MTRWFLPLLLATSTVTFGQIRFEDAAPDAGIDFQLNNDAGGMFHQIELMLAGIAAFDYNNDGCTDIFFINGAAIPSLKKTGPEFYNRLYRNNCDLTFTDVTKQAGVAGEGYSMAVATADYDNDGFADLFVAGVNQNILYHNRGDGTFADVTEAAGMSGVDPKLGKMWSISAGWLDYDNDGRLDLFISNYARWTLATEPRCGPPDAHFYCHPDVFQGWPNQLFHNNGDGTFTDVSRRAGITEHVGKGMGVTFADFNLDGLIDVFVANDSVQHFLFENRRDGTFEEIGLEAGVSLREDGAPIAGMGADFRDFDNDGRPDIVVCGMIDDTFQIYRNTSDTRARFDDETIRSGLARATRLLTSWSMGMYDFDNDGWKDLFFASSHFPKHPRVKISPLKNRVFRNLGNGRVEDVTAAAGADFQKPALHHGAAFADFDNDGRVDVVVNVLNAPAKLFRNVTTGGAHWAAFRLEGTRSNRDGIGARLRVTLPGGEKLYNHVTTSVGYASSSELPARFGLGAATAIESVKIWWPSGAEQELKGTPVDRIVEVREPEDGQS